MTRKRFRKLLMSLRVSPRTADRLIDYIKICRHSIEEGKEVFIPVFPDEQNPYYYDDTTTVTVKFKSVKIFPYKETFERILRGETPCG